MYAAGLIICTVLHHTKHILYSIADTAVHWAPGTTLHPEYIMHAPDELVHFLHGVDGLAEMGGMGHSYGIPGQMLAHLPDAGIFALVFQLQCRMA